MGAYVRNLRVGDRVVIPSTIGCGTCSILSGGVLRAVRQRQPARGAAGSAFFGGPENTGSFDGLQAEFARAPFGNVGLVPLPDSVTDDQAILLSDIYPRA